MPGRRATRYKRTARTVEVGVKVPLTSVEVRKLRDLPAADLRSVAGYVGRVIVEALASR